MSEVNDVLSADLEDSDENLAKAIENFKKAGKIAESIKKDIYSLVSPGSSVLDIAETMEKSIIDAGAKCGFPVNISINDIAAHYTPSLNDELLIGDNDVVKVDFGVSVDGCIADNAVTLDMSDEQGKLLLAAKEALDEAVASIKPGVGNGEIGKIIEDKIKSHGFKPIENLTGHKLEPYNLHAGIDIPNVSLNSNYQFEEGDVFAVEPFASAGAGRVADQSTVEIYSVVADGKLRMRSSRELLLKLVNEHLTLPFAKRWVEKNAKSKLVMSASIKELMNAGCLYPYHVLRDVDKGLISQFEHTLIIEHDGAFVIDGEIKF